MKTYNNYDLFRHNSMHLHCIASDVYLPENEEELVELVSNLKSREKVFHVIGAGSNIVLPKKMVTPTILLSSFSKSLSIRNGIIEVGASVRIQHLIRDAQKHNLGGIEYLFSVPCTVGGATVMNAGRGNGKQSIGNYVKQVRCLNTNSGEIELLNREECCFSYRNSIFLRGCRIILSVYLELERKNYQAIEDGINERKQFALEKLDDRRPSCGSIFNKSNGAIMRRLMGLRIGGAEWSPKKSDWISNRGKATNSQVRILIYLACFLHRITFKPYHLEVEIWKK